MQFSNAFHAVAVGAHPGSFTQIREAIDAEWIEQALHATGKASLRRRRLPAEQVLWLVLGIALFRERSIVEVAAKLDLALPGARGLTAASSSISEARNRLGEEPLAWLFARTAQEWTAPSAQRHLWRGLNLYAIDGTCLRLPDSEANRQHFGALSGKRGVAAYPQARLVVLMAVRSHLILQAQLGACTTDERVLAEQVLPALPPQSLLIMDRNFLVATTLLGLQEKGQQWLVRLRKDRKLRLLREIAPGDCLVELSVSAEARKSRPDLPKTYCARAISYHFPGAEGPQVLLTSLLDPQQYPAEEIVALYHERWEIELGYDEIKTEVLLQRETLRSQSPKMLEQEIWGLLLVYNLVRLEMEQVAHKAEVSPSRISFVAALRLIRDEWLWCAIASPGAIPRHLVRLRQELSYFLLPERRSHRRFPRAVKRQQSKFPRKRSPAP